MTARLIIVRHGPTKLNAEHRLRGWANPPVDNSGIEEVQKLADSLKKEHTKVDVLVSSDLVRSITTAKLIGETLGVPQLKLDWHFRPWNIGDFTGEESKKAHPELMKYVKERTKKVPGGESFDDFDRRFMGALESLLKAHENDTVMVVTHHRGDRVVAANLGGTFDPDQIDREGIPPASHVVYSHKGGKISK